MTLEKKYDNPLHPNPGDLLKSSKVLFANLDQNKHAEGYIFLDNNGNSANSG